MVAISKTPEYLLFVNNLKANNYEAIKEVLDGLYIIIDDTKNGYDALIVIKNNVVRDYKEVIKGLKEEVKRNLHNGIRIPENVMNDIKEHIQKLQEALNDIEIRSVNMSVRYEYLISTPIYKYRSRFIELRKIYQVLREYHNFYRNVYEYEDRLEDLEYEIEELKVGIEELKEKYIQGGGRVIVKYKSTGEHAHILYNNRKLKRCIYTKTKGRRKYCKINNKYILLSKLKIINI
jgi:hypothetical protein